MHDPWLLLDAQWWAVGHVRSMVEAQGSTIAAGGSMVDGQGSTVDTSYGLESKGRWFPLLWLQTSSRRRNRSQSDQTGNSFLLQHDF